MKTDIFSYNQFVDDLKNKEVVFFFGAGISNSLTKKRLGWKEWIQKGINEIKDIDIVKELNDRLAKSSSADELMNIVSDVIDTKKKDNTYSIWMKESFERNEIADLELVNTLKLLTISNDVLVTTNYDLLLEKATGLDSLSYVDTDKSFRMIDSRRNDSVIHIHGIYDSSNNIDNIVATKEQYENILNDKGAQFIQNIIGTRTIIFIGCGKTTEDVNISQFIEFASKYLKMDVDYYYLSNSNSHIEGLSNNIHLINYGNEYDDLEPFLKDLAIERIKSKTKDNRVVGINRLTNIIYSNDSLLRYHFSQQCIPFCGRDDELTQLHSFIDDNKKESWWAITGQAGAGKSRLALELIEQLPHSWFGFFFDDKANKGDIENYQPFCDTLVVIDYVAGREIEVFDYINAFLDVFQNTDYKIRILLLERENGKETGTWYSKLLNRGTTFQKDYLISIEFQSEFLYLEDLSQESVKAFIHYVCQINGHESNDEENTMLLNEYGSKFERLQFRPLYVQLFVESWVSNNFLLPSYDDYTSLIEELLRREQNKWLESLNNDVEVCNACIRLLVRANISPIHFDHIPELYRDDWKLIEDFINSHSLPGKQKYEFKNVLIRSLCHNIDHSNEIVAPQFPDLIKEYMFYYYTDEKALGDVMKEIWENASYNYSIFIRRCLMDFQNISFYRDSLNAYEKINSNIDALNGRLDLLDNVRIKRGDNPFVYLSLINNEYQFWLLLPIPPAGDKDKDIITSLKITGLFKVASNIGGWVVKDVTPVVRVAKDIFDVDCSENSEPLKKIALSKIAANLAESFFINESNYILELLNSLGAEENNDLDSLMAMDSNKDIAINELVAGNEKEALKAFSEAFSYVNYNDVDSCRMGASLCLVFLSASKEFESSFQPIVLAKVIELNTLYPKDNIITFRKIACETIELEYRYFSDAIDNESLTDYLTTLDNKLILENAFDNDELDAYAEAFARVNALLLNIASKEKVEEIISKCNSILSLNKRLSVVAYTLNLATLCLYVEHLKKVAPTDVVNSLYKYVEANSDSETVIMSFFTLLNESEKKGQEEDYLNEQIIATINHDMDYSPREYETRKNDSGTYRRINRKIGPNEPCPCGSGKKFKKCCRGNGKYD